MVKKFRTYRYFVCPYVVVNNSNHAQGNCEDLYNFYFEKVLYK